MNKILEVKNITKIYKIYKNNFDRLKEIFLKKDYHKEFTSNKDISFDLYEGETLGIIGVNGAGKSTILKLIAGVISQTSGEIIRHGRVTALLELGTGFNNEQNGRDNIYLNGTLIGMSNKEIDENLKNIIEFSELGDYINEPIRTYSSGMQMRLAFSIAIFSNPKVLIVDEALSVGDAHFSAKCSKALKSRKEKNMSIIYVSHDLNSLKLLCDRAILLHKGEVVITDTPENVINNYNFLIAKLNDDESNIKIDMDKKNSFGTFEVEIKSVNIKKDGNIVKDIQTGDIVDIEIELDAKIDVSNATIGMHIRDKFAQDIYGTNTFYKKQVMKLEANNTYLCTYTMPFNIGVGKYSLGLAIHTGDWHTEQCYHWLDNALNFTISASRDDFFIGLCRLEPSIKLVEINK
ncbi:MAG: ABC transporter ATP-binding protein [Sulfurimonas sp.]|nr:MAG: ABC transporter ATP-binding protein [Sulfurimonas sp.]